MASRDERAVALSEVAYEQATSALAEQRQVLDGLRSRAGMLLSGATIATSFLGGQALAVGPPEVLSWLAIGCFVGVGATSIAILWPRLAVETTARPLALDAADDPRNHPTASVRLALAKHMHASYGENETHVARIAAYLRTGAVSLMLEVVGG